MQRALVTLGAVWLAACIAAYFYSQNHNIPAAVGFAVLPAFLLEIALYLGLGSEALRNHLEKWPSWALALALTVTATLPYAWSHANLGVFRIEQWGALFGLAALAAFWYVILPHHGGVDFAFLVAIAAVMLLKPFDALYDDPHHRVPLHALGQLMWIRTSAYALLCIRRMRVGFGFLPTRQDWTTGLLYYLAFLPFGGALLYWLGFASFRLPPQEWWRASLLAIGTFLGMLWVVALSEEFVFRGLLQQWIGAWTKSEIAGLLIASALFGSVHLWFRAFPNWRFALIAGVAGVFYGLAFRSGKSIRTSMVTHALTATTWRVFFS
jgi:membrane protease YdiL (CAAX protease family)